MTDALLASVLLPYQQRWVADLSPVKLAEKSRRVGLTWAEAADDALYAASAKGDDVYYIGYHQDLALEFIQTCGTWAKAFALAASEIEDAGEVLEDVDKEKGILAYKIRFASGHKIVALSSKPRNLRGRQGRVVLDEFAFHEEQSELIKAAMALLMWGGAVRIISTHNGIENGFNELVTEIRAHKKPYSLHRITFDEAVTEGLYRRICMKLGRDWSREGELAWATEIRALYGEGASEELDCIPRSGGGVYLPGALIEARMSADAPVVRWECDEQFVHRTDADRAARCQEWCASVLAPLLALVDPQLESVFGEDFGRSGDLTVIWPMQIRRDLVRATPFVVELRNVPFKQQEQILFYIVDRLPRLRAGKLDGRGNGQYLSEVAMQKYGAGRIEQVMLSAEWYRTHMPPYKAAYEDAMLVIPRDADIKDDHRAIRVEKGVARIPESGRGKGTDGKQRHGDSAIAGCLAYAASEADTQLYACDTVPRASQGGAGGQRDFDRPPQDTVSPYAGRFAPGAF